VNERHEGESRPSKHEVEILPPLKEDRGFYYSTTRGTVKIVRLGPLGSLAVALTVGLVLALGFLFLSGMFLLLIPVVLLGGVGAYLAGRFGGFGRLPR